MWSLRREPRASCPGPPPADSRVAASTWSSPRSTGTCWRCPTLGGVPRQDLPARPPASSRSAATSTRLATALRRQGVRAPATYPVREPDGVDGIFARFGRPSRVWCRPRTGTCARGGGAVSTPDQARRLDGGCGRPCRASRSRLVHPRRVPARARDPLSKRVASRPDGPRQHVRAAVVLRRGQHPERRDVPVVAGQDRGRARRGGDLAGAAIAAVAPGRLRGLQRGRQGGARWASAHHRDQRRAVLHGHDGLRPGPQAQHRPHLRAAGARRSGSTSARSTTPSTTTTWCGTWIWSRGCSTATTSSTGCEDASDAAQLTVRPLGTARS